MKNLKRHLVVVCMALLMTISLVMPVVKAEERDGEGVVHVYGDYTFTKVSNPTAGSKEPDGINTNDITGFPANRLNSYAWAVTSRGDCIYIGTNRTLFGSALNAVTETLLAQNPDVDPEMIKRAVTLVSGGDVPVDLQEEDYIPQIIKFDVKQGTTEVIYQPMTVRGEDGRLYYTDKDGQILPDADVASETASFRSVIQYNGNLYFGSLGTNMLQLVRVDEEDNASVVFQTIGLVSSLRACTEYDDGDGSTIYFGGQDTTYGFWRKYRMEHPGEEYPLPIVIRRLDPKTAGSDDEDWSGLVADFSDFGKYSYASVYVSGGGNVWDLCSYNDKLYLILAYDGGWALFRGEKGGDNPNKFGWTWKEIVGDEGKYPLAMNEEVAKLNKKYNESYGCSEYASSLKGAGLLESTATPYVYNGKMYIGSFDNATSIQSETVIKAMVKLQAMQAGQEGPTLEQIFAPIYQVLTHQQHIWVMDEDENIVEVEGANALLKGTTNDYVWRFIEYDGKLYTGTFDAATAYTYFVNASVESLMSLLDEEDKPGYLSDVMNGTFATKLKNLTSNKTMMSTNSVDKQRTNAAVDLAECIEAFFHDLASVDDLLKSREALENVGTVAFNTANAKASAEARQMVDWMADAFDIVGLAYWSRVRKIVNEAESGFDIFVTGDGEDWEKIVGNGSDDPYNYGARTFTICNDELYVGTANPYYGGQIWKITEKMRPATVVKEPTPIDNLTYTGEPQELIVPGESNGGTMYYAVVDGDGEESYTSDIPTAINAGTYYVYYLVKGDEKHLDGEVVEEPLVITIDKADPVYEAPEGLEATYGQKLKEVALPEGWQWLDGEQDVADVGMKSFTATFTPSDTDNYRVVENIAVNVKVNADKTKLEDVIEEAETYFDSISDDKPNIAGGLQQVISLAKVINETDVTSQKEVDDAVQQLLAALASAQDDANYTGFMLADGTKYNFVAIDGEYYWYENNIKQGTYDDEKGVKDTQFGEFVRGREIFDFHTNAWYWLDAVKDGAVAKNKEVWMPYIYRGEEPGSTGGKWVRYDRHGQMIKGWYANDNGVYYYDLTTGEMYKGTYTFHGVTYTFDALTGIRQ